MTLNTIVSGSERTCPICRKRFWAYSEWAYKTGYKHNEVYYCSYGHMRQVQQKEEKALKPARNTSGKLICRYCGSPLAEGIERCTWCRRKIRWDATRRK